MRLSPWALWELRRVVRLIRQILELSVIGIHQLITGGDGYDAVTTACFTWNDSDLLPDEAGLAQCPTALCHKVTPRVTLTTWPIITPCGWRPGSNSGSPTGPAGPACPSAALPSDISTRACGMTLIR